MTISLTKKEGVSITFDVIYLDKSIQSLSRHFLLKTKIFLYTHVNIFLKVISD